MPAWGLTETGLVVPREADLLAEMQARYELSVGLSVDWDADQFQAVAIAVAANRLGAVAELLQAIYDSMDPAAATGVQLDVLSSITGARREAATRARATVTLTGTTGTVIPAGALVEGGGADDRARWTLDADVTLAAGTGTGLVVALDAGALVAVAATVDKIVTPVSGWTAVTNAADATPGLDRETNAAFRVRRLAALQGRGSRSLGSLTARLLEVDGVSYAAALDNPTDAAVVTQGISLDAHSVAVVLYPSTLTAAEKEEVATILYAHVADGIKTMGTDVVATVTMPSGATRAMAWDYAAQVAVQVDVTVTALATGLVIGDVDTLIEDAIDAYFGALAPGETARMLALTRAIGAVPGVLAMTLQLDAGVLDVSADLDEVLIASPVAVT